HWFHNQFVQLVQNAFPVVGAGPSCTTPPSAPATFTATAVSSSEIDLKWSAVAPPANCSVSYNVYRSTTNGFTPSAATRIQPGIPATAVADTGLPASTTFFYIVEAVDGAGAAIIRGSATTQAGTNPACTAVPAAVTNLVASPTSSTQINLTWNA